MNESFWRDFFHMGAASVCKPVQCRYCGLLPHGSLEQCPQVARIEYYQDGSIKAVQKR